MLVNLKKAKGVRKKQRGIISNKNKKKWMKINISITTKNLNELHFPFKRQTFRLGSKTPKIKLCIRNSLQIKGQRRFENKWLGKSKSMNGNINNKFKAKSIK